MSGERLCKLDTRESRHVDVEEDDVVRNRLDELERLHGIARLAHDFDTTRFTQQVAQL